jgi:hypothetical protein
MPTTYLVNAVEREGGDEEHGGRNPTLSVTSRYANEARRPGRLSGISRSFDTASQNGRKAFSRCVRLGA